MISEELSSIRELLNLLADEQRKIRLELDSLKKWLKKRVRKEKNR